jgi:hypothetical protein
MDAPPQMLFLQLILAVSFCDGFADGSNVTSSYHPCSLRSFHTPSIKSYDIPIDLLYLY